MKGEPGYPKSILRDFMGCHMDLDPDEDADAGRKLPDVNQPPFDPDAGRDPDRSRDGDGNDGNGDGNGGGDGKSDDVNDVDYKPEDDVKDVDVVLKVDNNDIILVTVPLVLVLCILGLIYAIISMLQRKGAPRLLVHCKRSLQDWV